MTTPVLVIGGSGQLATALSSLGRIAGRPVVAVGRPRADLADKASLGPLFQAIGPSLVINAAAYTAVDKAETEPHQAFLLNAQGPEILARLCSEATIPLVHVSTDYVFDGTGKRPYREDDPIAPLGVYGASKAEGESRVRATLARHIIARTAWVYSEQGSNFLKTMLRLGAERPLIGIVDDQRGSPTYAADLASALGEIGAAVLEPGFDKWGAYNLTNAGETTWYGLAQEIFQLAGERGHRVPRLEPIATSDYPTPARRPAYSVLDPDKTRSAFGLRMADWREALRRCFTKLELGRSVS